MTGATGTSRPPRVLYLLSHPIQYQVPLLQYLAASGRVDVHTLFVRDAGASTYFDQGFGREVRWDLPLTSGYSHEFLRGYGPANSWGRFTPWSVGLAAALKTHRPDVVWTHGYDTANAVRLLMAAKRARLPVLVRAEVEQSDAAGGPLVRAAKDRALRCLYPAVDGFLTIGKRNADFYRQRGVPEHKLHAAPYAVDNASFAASAFESLSAVSLAEEYDLPACEPVFLWSGKLIARKRPLDAVQGLAELRRRGGRASLVIFGSGELEPDCRQLVKYLGLEGSVRFAGFVNQGEMRRAYARAAALLLTSERERWGLVANEAMASGCPVICSDAVGCANDLVGDGTSGKVVPLGSFRALADAMAELGAEGRRAELGAGAILRVQEFSFASVEAGLLAAIAAVTPVGLQP